MDLLFPLLLTLDLIIGSNFVPPLGFLQNYATGMKENMTAVLYQNILFEFPFNCMRFILRTIG